MEHKAKSIRPFIGSENFDISRRFYSDLGFQEHPISHNLTYFSTDGMGFYLQDYYAKDWVDNTMVFMEVDDVDRFWKELMALDLPARYEKVRLVPVREMDWGKECFVHDPAGILWHFGKFK